MTEQSVNIYLSHAQQRHEPFNRSALLSFSDATSPTFGGSDASRILLTGESTWSPCIHLTLMGNSVFPGDHFKRLF